MGSTATSDANSGRSGEDAHAVARPLPTAVEVDAIVAALRALFIAQVVDPAELQRWHERLRQPISDPAGAAP